MGHVVYMCEGGGGGSVSLGEESDGIDREHSLLDNQPCRFPRLYLLQQQVMNRQSTCTKGTSAMVDVLTTMIMVTPD